MSTSYNLKFNDQTVHFTNVTKLLDNATSLRVAKIPFKIETIEEDKKPSKLAKNAKAFWAGFTSIKDMRIAVAIYNKKNITGE